MSNTFTGLVRIGSDPELRFTPSGKSVLTFSAASNTGFGEKKKTLWLRATVWNNAEKIKEYLSKGGQIVISGELSQNDYTANDGTKKSSLEINVSYIDLVGSKSDSPAQGQQPAAQSQNAHPRGNQPPQSGNFDAPYDDGSDIPF